MRGVSNGHDTSPGDPPRGRGGPGRATGWIFLLRCPPGPSRPAFLPVGRRREPTRRSRSSSGNRNVTVTSSPRRRLDVCARPARGRRRTVPTECPDRSNRLSGENPARRRSRSQNAKVPTARAPGWPTEPGALELRRPRLAVRVDLALIEAPCASCRRRGFHKPSRLPQTAPSPSAPCSGRDGISSRASRKRIRFAPRSPSWPRQERRMDHAL